MGLSSQALTRRNLFKVAGLAGAGGVAAHLDPALAATMWRTADGINAAYEAPSGRAKDSAAKRSALGWVGDHEQDIIGLADAIWEHAELSMREWQSQWALAEMLRSHGFAIRWGVAGMPGFFVGRFAHGSGGPTIGFSCESDALPGLSQEKGRAVHAPRSFSDDPYRPHYGAGHGCAHNTLGAGAAAAAVATASAMRSQGVPGTVLVFGSVGEEHLAGKAFAVRDGAYDGVDVMLDWHPWTATTATWSSTLAMKSVVFTFLGVSGHGASPLGNKSALDGVQLLSVLTEYLREENVSPTGRFHSAMAYAGEAPNVTPEIAHAWYFVREATPARLEVLLDKIAACARAAAEASQTKLVMRVHSAVWNVLGNQAGTELLHENMRLLGPPLYSPADHDLARAIQRTLGVPEVGLSTEIAPLVPATSASPITASTDIADVSWRVPLVFGLVTTWPLHCPIHHWNVASTAATGIAHQGLLSAARYLAATAVDLLTQPDSVRQIRDEFEQRTTQVKWKSLLPPEAQPPLYQPPEWFLRRTGQSWPPPGMKWPPERFVSHGTYGTVGPPIPATS